MIQGTTMQSTNLTSNSSSDSRTLDECYEITDECLGEGSNGHIKTIVCRKTGTKFALKTLDIKTIYKRKEASIELDVFNVARGHNNLVQMRDVFHKYPNVFIVMEALEGDLYEYCVKNALMKEDKAAQVIGDVAKALSHLHNLNIAHRDVKLDNMFHSEKNFFPIKLGDYGFCSDPGAKSCCENHGNHLYSRPVGTVIYLPPEIAKLYQGKPGHYTKQCDMWSLGVVLYVILTGNFPFDVDIPEGCQCIDKNNCNYCTLVLNAIINNEFSMDSAWESIPMGAKDLIKKLLMKNPNERYKVDEVLEHPWIRHWNH